MSDPIVLISSYPPRTGNVAAFTEEAREFIQKHNPDHEVLVISHTDGQGNGVFPLIDPARPRWWRPVLRKLDELGPYAVHVQHDAGAVRRRRGDVPRVERVHGGGLARGVFNPRPKKRRRGRLRRRRKRRFLPRGGARA